jgi:polysaccharide export outer membrane protein
MVRKTMLLIRETIRGDKLIVRIDLTSSGLFTSPYYYLKSNDVIYVEPSQNREKKERFAQVTPIILSVVSLLIITISAIEYRK